jgi:Na+-driven multidrug efflux pump
MSVSNSKRVAFNSVSLYLNMIVTMVATLLATRFVLQALGEEQYGIYMLLASVVALFSFLNITMAASIQRYLSYAMGEGNECKVKEIFYLSILIHLLNFL